MYKNVCRHCHAEIECENDKLFANHVRWCNPEVDRSRSKFVIECSCIICKRKTTIQSLKAHIAKHDKVGKINHQCPWCDGPVYNKHNKFCSSSCAAYHTNSKVDRTKFKPGPVKGWAGPEIPKYILNKRKNDLYVRPTIVTITYIEENCKVCGNIFKKGNTSKALCCSKDCRMSIISLNRGRHKKSWLELSFSDWLDSKHILYETEVTVKNIEENKWYYVDFLFQDLNLIIELDGSQHKDTVESDTKRDNYLRSIGYTVLRITHEEYQSKLKIEEVCSLLNIL